jgi:peptide/nickel transport system ATP-binding protein/oligopeptide transport system ATP-binding protein
VIDRCRVERPQLRAESDGHATACHRIAELPPPDAIVPAGSAFSPALERLVAAFTDKTEVPPAPGVGIINATSPAGG